MWSPTFNKLSVLTYKRSIFSREVDKVGAAICIGALDAYCCVICFRSPYVLPIDAWCVGYRLLILCRGVVLIDNRDGDAAAPLDDKADVNSGVRTADGRNGGVGGGAKGGGGGGGCCIWDMFSTGTAVTCA